MGAFEKITVSVPSETAAAMRQSVADGHYVTESDIVGAALADWTRSCEKAKAQSEWLREQLAEADEGPFYSEEEAFAMLEADDVERQAR